MTGLDAGLPSEGHHVFIYSIADFPPFRCAEQIRNDIDYQSLLVTIEVVAGGLAYGALSYSRSRLQDYARMRSFPNMLLAAPGDPRETRACMRYLVPHPHPQPCDLRLGKADEHCFPTSPPEVAPGRWVRVADAPDLSARPGCLLTTGAPLVLAVCKQRTEQYRSNRGFSMPFWGVRRKANQPAEVNAWPEVITIEDDLRDGGFGSWLLESLPPMQGLHDRLECVALDAIACKTVDSQRSLNTLGGTNEHSPSGPMAIAK